MATSSSHAAAREIQRDSPSTAADVRKAAVLLASLPDEERALLLQQLTPDQLERLAAAAAHVDQVAGHEQQALRDTLLAASDDGRAATDPQAVHLAACAERLEAADPQIVAQLLQRELPQTIALLLAHLGVDPAADVLACLSSEQQLEVVRRLACLTHADAPLVAELLPTLAHSVWLRQRPANPGTGGEMRVAQLVNRLGPASERALLVNLAQEDRALVDRLLQKMFLLRDLQRPILLPAVPPPTRRSAA